jgi:hypothetical protein
MRIGPSHKPRQRPPALLCAVLVFVVGLTVVPTRGQVPSNIAYVEPKEATADAPLTMTLELLQGGNVDRVYLIYRPYGEGQYQSLEMNLVGNSASVTLPSNVVHPPFLEYYIVLADRQGNLTTHPVSEGGDPFSAPPARTLALPIRAAPEEGIQVLFLSPDPSEVLEPEDIVIAVSLLRADTFIVRRATQVFLDGRDVTSKAVFSDDMIVVVPQNLGIRLSPGEHQVGVRVFGREGNLQQARVHRFTVKGDIGYRYAQPVRPEFTYRASIYAESRREVVASGISWYNRGGYQFRGSKGEWRLHSNAFVTSDEQKDRQPQNRFFVGVESPWISAGFGDSHPSFPSLILSGKRVRGLNTSLRLGVFNLDLALGQTLRSIDGALLSSFPRDSLGAEQSRDRSAAYGPINDTTWGKFSYGTYERQLFAVRPSFGSGETWQLGFTWLNSKDDMSSIQYGQRPKENIVLGTDFVTRLDRNRIELHGQAAFSAYNSDISSGSFTDAYIDTVYPDNADDIKTIRDILDPFITVNDNLRPLSLKTLSTLAYDLGTVLNYFNNNLRVTYLYRGLEYTSFGQTFIRKDIQGLRLLDRLRLLNNSVLLTLGFEQLQDNTSNTKVATTVFRTVNIAASYYAQANLPSVTVGYTNFVNDNDLNPTGMDSILAIDDITNRFFLQSSYNFIYRGQHTAILNLTTSQRDDRTVRETDVSNTIVTVGLTSRYAIPLQTTVEIGLNFNSFPPTTRGGERRSLDFTSVALTGKYVALTNILTFMATVAPTFGELKRTVVDMRAEWFAIQAMSFTLQFSYFKNTGVADDSYISLRYRYDI